jgi:hypothetical protein
MKKLLLIATLFTSSVACFAQAPTETEKLERWAQGLCSKIPLSAEMVKELNAVRNALQERCKKDHPQDGAARQQCMAWDEAALGQSLCFQYVVSQRLSRP